MTYKTRDTIVSRYPYEFFDHVEEIQLYLCGAKLAELKKTNKLSMNEFIDYLIEGHPTDLAHLVRPVGQQLSLGQAVEIHDIDYRHNIDNRIETEAEELAREAS